MNKTEFKTAIKLKRAAVEALRADYLETLEGEIKRAGSMVGLAKLLGRSESFIRMVKKDGGLMTVKNCVEEIAVKLYGWDGK